MPFDAKSLDANRHGRLSRSQWRLVRSEMCGWLISAMGTAGFGLLIAFALPLWLAVMASLVVGAVAFYMAAKGYDCSRDSVDRRIGAITGSFTASRVETGSTNGMRTLVTVRGRRFWVPTRAVDEVGDLPVTLYFTPLARIVVNVEPALLDSVQPTR